MTPTEGYARARYQRPGIVIAMGPHEATERWIKPLSPHDLQRLPGDPSFWARDMRMRLGFVPSSWARCFAEAVIAEGHEVKDDEWRWLSGPASLEDAREWVSRRISPPRKDA